MPRIAIGSLLVILLGIAMPVRAQTLAQLSAPDALSWLNGAHDPKAISWAADQTKQTLERLTGSPVFPKVEQEIHAAESKSQPKPTYFLLGDKIVRFTRDRSNPRGVFAVSPQPVGLRAKEGAWRNVLDVDALDKREGKNLEVMFLDLDKTCLAPAFDRCLIPFGAGGSSLIQYREFDFGTGQFVPDGFATAPSRGSVVWLDRSTLLIAHAQNDDGLLPSGFPKTVYRWKRGTPITRATPVMSGAATDAVLDVYPLDASMPGQALIALAKDYATFELYLVGAGSAPSRIALPTKLQGFGEPHIIGSTLVVQLAADATIDGRHYASDSLIAYDLKAPSASRITTIYAPSSGKYVNDPFSGIVATADGLGFVVTERLSKSLVFATRRATGWSTTTLATAPPGVAMHLDGADPVGNTIIVEETGFLKPTEVSLVASSGARDILFHASPIIDATKFVSEVKTARSADGTMIDYYLVRPRAPKPGPVPVILYGYGGYGVNADPSYFEGGLGPSLVSWLNRGGAYAVAAVRGGSERGSAWALAAKGIHRQRSFEDFAAVARAMIGSGFTSRAHLGSFGRSFGGLLSANMVTQYPDLFGAALVGVPIVDLFRLGTDGNDISAGQKIEVGDWTDPKQVPLMLRYSPYQNIRAGVDYPHVLTVSSTSDGQVGPGHARRFVAKLQSVGADAMLMEGPTGGHGFPDEFTNPREYAGQVTFFIDTLMN
ncbi:S9 family peptidase [Sphingomonas koreensis]|nr:S9 family peptidase [Sphingomonas koreensis]